MKLTGLFLACFLSLRPAAAAPPSPILAALRARDWTAATALAGRNDMAALYVTYSRLLVPGAATPEEIAAFLGAHADWPRVSTLTKRLAEGLQALRDDVRVLGLCRVSTTALNAALRRCAAAAHAARAPEAAQWARRAWRETPGADDDDAFHATWSAVLTAEDEWVRFDALDSAGDAAAARLLPDLSPAHAALAAARLALRARSDTAPARVDALAAPERDDPPLVLALARYWRARGDLGRAAKIWAEAGATAEAHAQASRRAAFWQERDRLARLLLAAGDLRSALAVADDASVPAEQATDALFLSGYLALRLNDRARATRLFTALRSASGALITQGRAAYFLGRAAADEKAAREAFTQAATYPTTFYGQLALRALVGDQAFRAAFRGKLSELHDPAVPAGPVRAAFDRSETVQTARVLAMWGDPAEARVFLQRRIRAASTAEEFALGAAEARALALPDQAVLAARLAGVRGTPMLHAGWPRLGTGETDPLLLGIIRQESSFDPGAVSASGAIGLMQLMPTTGRELARLDGRTADPDLFDPATNARLGANYVRRLLDSFNGVAPFAIAAYNAGPSRVRGWLTAAHTDLAPLVGDALVDWIETIPFAETRNYVQRVLENTAIYDATGTDR